VKTELIHRRNDIVAEDFTPAAEGFVAGGDEAGAFIAGRDEWDGYQILESRILPEHLDPTPDHPAQRLKPGISGHRARAKLLDQGAEALLPAHGTHSALTISPFSFGVPGRASHRMSTGTALTYRARDVRNSATEPTGYPTAASSSSRLSIMGPVTAPNVVRNRGAPSR
jgi:hypothetical protein